MYAYVAHHPHASLVFHMSHFIPAMKWDKIFHECAFSTPFYVFSLIFISSYCNFDVHSVVVVHKRKSKRKTLKAMQQQAHSNCIEMKKNAIGFTKNECTYFIIITIIWCARSLCENTISFLFPVYWLLSLILYIHEKKENESNWKRAIELFKWMKG